MCSKNFLRPCFAVLAAALAAVLVWMAVPHLPYAGTGGAQIFIPKAQSEGMPAPGEAPDGKLVYTYEARQNAVLHTPLRDVRVTLVSVNHAYAQVTGLPLTAGSFFTAYAEETRARHIVLNGQAAFELFGNRDIIGERAEIDGQSYEIVGVLADGLADAAAYISGTHTEAKAQAFMALPDETNGITAAHVQSLMRQAGVTTTDFYVFDAGVLHALAPGKALFLGTLLLAWLGVLCLRVCAVRLAAAVSDVRERMKRHYIGGLLRHENAALARAAAWGLAVCGVAVGLIVLFLGWLNLFLVYDPLPFLTGWNGYMLPHFTAVLASLFETNGVSTMVLAGAVCGLVGVLAARRT